MGAHLENERKPYDPIITKCVQLKKPFILKAQYFAQKLK